MERFKELFNQSKLNILWLLVKRIKVGIIFTAMILAMILLWWMWGRYGVQFFAEMICKTGECVDLAKLGQMGDIFGGINALIAAFALAFVAYTADSTRRANIEERIRHNNDNLVEQVCKSYSWAYDALTDEGDNIPPASDPYSWASAARHLLRAEMLSKKITDIEAKIVVDGHASYWQHWFRKAIGTKDKDTKRLHLAESGYFELASRKSNVPIDRCAWPILVVLNFCNTHSGIDDPITFMNPENYGKAYEGEIGVVFKQYWEYRQRNPRKS